MSEQTQLEQWAVIELMGHGITAGIIRPSDLGGLLRVDVPVDDDGFRTEYYGNGAIYSVKITSEEIARAYAMPVRDISPYDEPVVPRAEFEKTLHVYRENTRRLENQINMLQRRLTAVTALEDKENE